jgi:hypothetical protein
MWRGQLQPMRLTIGILGEVEQFLLAERVSPMQRFREVSSKVHRDAVPAIHDAAIELEIKDNVATLEDIQSFLSSPAGVALVVWINLRDKTGETYEEAKEESELIGVDGCQRIGERLLQAGGIDERANLDWVLKKCDANGVDSGGSGSRVQWRKILREAFDEHGILPVEFADMTIYQFQMLTREKKELQGKLTIPIDEAMKMSLEERKNWRLKSVLRGRDWQSLYGESVASG